MDCLDRSIIGLANDFQMPINVCSIDIVNCCKGRKRIKASGIECFNDSIGHLYKKAAHKMKIEEARQEY
jgi:hypothetical protein